MLIPHPEVKKAWKLRKSMIDSANKLFWINGARIMNRADRKLSVQKYKQLEAQAEAIFLEAVVKYHGPTTVVGVSDGVFSLFETDYQP